MEMENQATQARRNRRNQLARARYQASRERNNLIRRAKRQQNLHAIINHDVPSSSNPQLLQESVPQIHLQNQHPLIFPTEYLTARNNFRSKLDSLKSMPTCVVCKEKYPGIKIRQYNGNSTCFRCISEKHGHRFSIENNMDPGEQPVCLQRLTQIEEMLIARVSPVLQVTYAKGGQLKYSGHTIYFP